MGAYSLDLRHRVLEDSKEGLSSKELSEKYRVSRAWVDRLKQRYRENGEIAPLKVGTRAKPILFSEMERLESFLKKEPDITLKELREKLGIRVALSTVWLAVRSLGYTLKKSPSRSRARSSRRR